MTNRIGMNIDLSIYAPYSGTKEMNEIYQLSSEQCGYLEYAYKDMLEQLSIQSATWGLNRWEKIFNIPVDLSLPIEQRREVVTAKLRGQGTTTVKMIKSVAESFSGGAVDIIENNEESSFTVKFVGTIGIPKNMTGFASMIDDIKPAHLQYQFEYKFNTHADLSKLTYVQLYGVTHYKMRNEVLNIVNSYKDFRIN